MSQSGRSDENVFRVPSLPPRPPARKKERGTAPVMEPLGSQDTNAVSTQPAVDDGREAALAKRAAMVKLRLDQRNQGRKAEQERRKQQEVAPRLDISLTEQTMVSGSVQPGAVFVGPPPSPHFSDISMIRHNDDTVMFGHGNNGIRPAPAESEVSAPWNGPVCSTPVHCPSTPVRGVRHAQPLPMSASSSVNSSRCTTPVNNQPAKSQVNQSVFGSSTSLTVSHETLDERMERQMSALGVWCNIILCADTEPEFDVGKTKQEANKRLQNLLKLPTNKISSESVKKMTYADFLEKQERRTLRVKAQAVMSSSEIPAKIVDACSRSVYFVHENNKVYEQLDMKTTILRVMLSFHPAWLHLGLETVFNEEISIARGESCTRVLAQFMNQRLFSDPAMLRNKKLAVGTVKKIITPAGRQALHTHFLTKSSLLLFFIESAKAAAVLPANPAMFVRTSVFKSIEDVCAELQREVLDARSVSMFKALAKIGFKPVYKQTFFDDFNYRVCGFSDLLDGVVLGKMMELISGMPLLQKKLRNPGGDRLRKLGNVRAVLQAAKEYGIDVDEVRADAIVGGNREAILGLLWRIVGIYVLANEENELRRASLVLAGRRTSQIGCAAETDSAKELVLHLCSQIGEVLGIPVRSLRDLLNGRLLAGAWQLYNPGAPDVHFFPGASLYEQVVNAAESELGVPSGLHSEVSLFTHLYLSRLFKVHNTHVAATRIQRAFRSYRLRKQMSVVGVVSRSDERLSDGLGRTFVVASQSCSRSNTQVASTPLILESTIEEDSEDTVRLEVDEAVPERETEGEAEEAERIDDEDTLRRESEENARREEEERFQREAEEKARIEEDERLKEAEERARIEAEESERLLREAEERARKEEEDRLERERLEEEERLRIEAEEIARREAAEKARIDAEEKERLQREAEEKARLEEEDRLKKKAEKARIEEAERIERERMEEEERLRHQEEEKARLEEEGERLKREAEEKARIEEAQRREAEERILEEQRLQREAEEEQRLEKMRIAEEERLKREAEEKRRLEEEDERLKREAEELARVQEEERLQREGEEKARIEEEDRLRREAEEKARAEEEARQAALCLATRISAATTIQKLWRGCMARQHYSNQLEDRRRFMQNIVLVQTAVRGWLARRHLAIMRSEKLAAVKSVAAVSSSRQVSIDDGAATANTNQLLESSQTAQAVAVVPEPSAAVNAPDVAVRSDQDHDMAGGSQPEMATPEEMYNLQRLYSEVQQLCLHQRIIERMLQKLRHARRNDSSVEERRSLEVVGEGTSQTKGTSRMTYTADDLRNAAALLIQRVFRGWRVRRTMRAEMSERAAVMVEYRNEMQLQDDGHDEAGMTVGRKIQWASAELTDAASQYRVKVAAHMLARLTSLSPQLCHLVIRGDGFNLILSAFENYLNQGMGAVDIAELLHTALLNLVKSCDRNQDYEQRVLQIAQPVILRCCQSLLRYFASSALVQSCVDTIIIYHVKHPSTRRYVGDMKYYFKNVSKKCTLLRDTDPRRGSINQLKFTGIIN